MSIKEGTKLNAPGGKASGALRRHLSPLVIWSLSVGCAVGWGAFVMPGTTFLPIAGPVGTAIAVIIGALAMGIIGINYSYLMVRHPGVGGVYTYTKSEFGRGHAFLSAWFLCLSYIVLIPANATALAVMFRTLFREAVEQGFHYQIAGYDMYLREAAIAVTVLVVFGALSIYCKSFLQYLLTGLAVIFLAGVVSLACIVLTRVPISELVQSPGFGDENPVAAILSIIVLAPWAFVGFEVISLETAHFQFPIKKSGRLMGLAIALGALIYISMTVVAISVVPDGYGSWQEYIRDLNQLKGYTALPTFFAVKKLLGEPGLILIGITATAAVLSGVIGFSRATNRILANMADDNILNGSFSNPRTCYVFIMTITTAMALVGRNTLGWFVDLSSVGAIVGFGYVSAVVLKTAKRDGDKQYKRFAVLGLAVSALFIFTQLMPRLLVIDTMEAESFLLLGLWCLLGYSFYYRTMRLRQLSDQGSETMTVSALFVLLFYSELV